MRKTIYAQAKHFGDRTAGVRVNGGAGCYRNKGLTIVGVHSPEFDDEKKVENLRREVTELGIHYPVVTDNDYATWHAYDVGAWPTLFVA